MNEKRGGRELAERVLKTHPEIKALFTSGYSDDVIGLHGVLPEDVDFIIKPYPPRALAAKVREILDR